MSTATTSTASGTASTTANYDFLNTRKDTALSTAKEQSDRFLKLLTTQLKNQDPLNPMDNAQMTSQMAQISTVSGIETLNASLRALSTQFMQLQVLQGAALVGHDVLLKGDRLSISDGVGRGSFDLAANASAVKVDVLNAAGGVVDSIELGAKSAGRQAFEWDAGQATDSAGYRFRVSASGSSGAVGATALMHDKVVSVNTGGSALQLQLQRSGSVGYDGISALN